MRSVPDIDQQLHRTIATSIVRLVYLPATLRSTDISWDAAPADVWT